MPQLLDSEFSLEFQTVVTAIRAADMLTGAEINAFARTIADSTAWQQTINPSFLGSQAELFEKMDAIANVSKALVEASVIERQLAEYNERFVIPLPGQIAQVAAGLIDFPTSRLLSLQMEGILAIGESLNNISAPWVDSANVLRSIQSASDLCILGTGLADLEPFGSALTQMLRTDLGDWRSVTAVPMEIFTDSIARLDFYREQGFNDALTDFPADAFNELLNKSHLRPRAWPAAALAYGAGLEARLDRTDEEVPRANREAFEVIGRLESRLRRFIHEQMSSAFTTDWPKHQTPAGMHEQWKERKQSAKAAGQPEHPIIAYADFSDYVKIIERNDNWKRVFASFFGLKTDIQESLRRLGPIRICIMHSRPITSHDQLILNAEAQRIFRAIRHN